MSRRASPFFNLYCQVPETRGDMVRRACVIERMEDGKTTSQDTLWIDMPELAVMPREDDAEPFLIMSLLPAMSEGCDLQIEGAVSKKLLSNLTEFRDIWHKSNPGRYKKIELSSSGLLEPRRANQEASAVAAFSGGVDSTFSVWRHRTKAAGHRALDIRCCAMVHGFDIPIWMEEPFTKIFSQCKTTLESLELDLYPIRTNCRIVFKLNWEMWHGPAVAASLQLFKGIYGAGVIASTYNSKNLVFPWGSNPVTDPLCGSDGFEIIHDGIAFNRIEKITAFRQWEAGFNNLRVCFTGIENRTITVGNCGKCTRCLQLLARLQFVGFPIPATFGSPPSALAILKLKPSTVFAETWMYTLKEGFNKRQRPALILAVAWITILSYLASVLKKFLQAVGIRESSI